MEQLAFSIKVTTNFLYFFINLKYFASGFGHTECNKNKHTECNKNKHTECNKNKNTECNKNKHTECNKNKHTECNKKQTYNLMIFSQNHHFAPKFVKIQQILIKKLILRKNLNFGEKDNNFYVFPQLISLDLSLAK